MAVQSERDTTTVPLLKSGNSFVRNGTIEQDATRTAILLENTVMAYNATTEMWVPFTVLNDTEGESVPRGIYVGDDIAIADLVAGDIEDAPIIIGGCATVDAQILIYDEDTLDGDSIVNPGTIEARSATQCLADIGLFVEDTINISEYEN